MRVSSIRNSSVFGADCNCSENKNKKTRLNPVSATGYLALGSFGGAMTAGINKKIKLHKVLSYAAIASAVSHVVLLSTHKHNKD